jgi:hypothetical protein
MEKFLLTFFGNSDIVEISSGAFWAILCSLFVNINKLKKLTITDYIKILLSIIITLRLYPVASSWIGLDLDLGNTTAVSAVTGAIAGLVGIKFMNKIISTLNDKLD